MSQDCLKQRDRLWSGGIPCKYLAENMNPLSLAGEEEQKSIQEKDL